MTARDRFPSSPPPATAPADSGPDVSRRSRGLTAVLWAALVLSALLAGLWAHGATSHDHPDGSGRGYTHGHPHLGPHQHGR